MPSPPRVFVGGSLPLWRFITTRFPTTTFGNDAGSGAFGNDAGSGAFGNDAGSGAFGNDAGSEHGNDIGGALM